jgi:hypothetical protein
LQVGSDGFLDLGERTIVSNHLLCQEQTEKISRISSFVLP